MSTSDASDVQLGEVHTTDAGLGTPLWDPRLGAQQAGTQLDGEDDGWVHRFGRTERAMHWIHAAGFMAMAATGLILYLPQLAELIGRRPLVKQVHLLSAVAWVVALLLVAVLGDRRTLRQTWGEFETIGPADRAWLRGRKAPQGRFNAGQKVNGLITAAFALLFLVSGTLLWLGERDHRFILDGTGTVHEVLTIVSLAILVGHLYLALVHPTTRHALHGITRGTVREEWARRHHPRG